MPIRKQNREMYKGKSSGSSELDKYAAQLRK
jgi:hypothetical protein